MNTPEVLLSSLTNNLLKLRAAISSEKNKQSFDEKINSVIRKIYLAQVLSNKSVTAVAGRQGAGKTTFLKNLYELDDAWLDPNLGRGEQVPLLVLERQGITEPCAEVIELKQPETAGESSAYVLLPRSIDSTEFKGLVKGWSGGQILVTLYVPKKYFENDNTGFLLLPGYEKINQDNKYWQDLMRHALLSSESSILVTDEQGLAANADEIRKDLFTQCITGARPVIVVSWSEGRSEEWILNCKSTVERLYSVPSEESDRVIFSGVSENTVYMDQWKTAAVRARNKYSGITHDFRFAQFSHMQETLDDLNDVIYQIKDSVNEEADVEPGVGFYRDMLKQFDMSVTSLRKSYKVEVSKLFESKKEVARECAKAEYNNEEAGLLNKIKNITDVFNSEYENEKRFITRVGSAWDRADSHEKVNFEETYLLSVFNIVNRTLRLSESAPTKATGLLGYGTQEVLKTSVVDSKIEKCLISIFKTPIELTASEQEKVSDAIKLIPVLALEYLRIGKSLIVESKNSEVSAPQNEIDLQNEIDQTTERYKDLKSTVFSAISAVFGLDAIDGSLGDIFQLPGGQSDIPYSPMTQLFGFVSLAVAAYSVLQQVKRYDAKQQGFIDSSLEFLTQNSVASYMSQFDNFMDDLRQYFQAKLSQRYGIDSRLGTRDSILHAVRNVDVVRKEMVGMLNAGPILA